MPSLFGLFGSNDRRRPPRGRGYTPMPSPTRRYERPETGRATVSTQPPRRPRREQREVSWRYRGMVALAVLGVVGLFAGGVTLYRSDVLRVRVIDVHGAQVADPQAVADASALAGASLLTLDLDGATRAIADLPAVKSATVARDWPQGVRIEITEHQAWGYWQAGSERLVIDEEGTVLQQSRPPAPDAPTIVEVASDAGGVQNVSADQDTVRLVHRLRSDGTFERLQVNPTSFVFRRDRGLTVIVAGSPAAVFGDSSNYEFKVNTWAALLTEVRAGRVPQVQGPAVQLAQGPATGGDPGATPTPAPTPSSSMVSEIDLRFGRNVVLR